RSESGPAPTNSGDKETQKWRILAKRHTMSDTLAEKMVSDTIFQIHLDDLRRLLDGADAVFADADRHERGLSAIEASEPPPAFAVDLDAAGDTVQTVRVLRRDVGRIPRRRPQMLDLVARVARGAKRGRSDLLVARDQLVGVHPPQVQHANRLGDVDSPQRKAHVVPCAKRRSR